MHSLERLLRDLRAGFATIWNEISRPWGEHLTFGPLQLDGQTYERRADKH